MKIITLVDNKTITERFNAEHGLSLYIEAEDNQKILYDTGQSDLFIENAQKLGIDLNAIDRVIISHGHYDHIGGLVSFLKINKSAKVYMNASIFDYEYFSVKNGVKKLNGFPQELMQYRERFILLNKNIQFDKICFITNIERTYNTPKGNSILYRQKDGVEEVDDFSHELVLVAEASQGLCVFTGCGHNGVLNIVTTVKKVFPDKEIKCLYGGFHLIDTKDFVETETVQELTHIARDLINLLPAAQFYTGHCTGLNAFNILKEVMGDKLEDFYVGKEVVI